jgi:DNA polymerase-3 subunit delta
MKLSPLQLGAQLTKRIAPIYLISGDEPLLKHDAIQLIRKALKKANINERIRFIPTVNFDWDELYAKLYGTSLLAEKTLLEFDFRENIPTKIAGQILKEYGNAPLLDKIIVIDLPKIDEKIAKSEWFIALEKAGVLMTAWPLSRDEFLKWIEDRAKKYKLEINQEAILFLASYVEGNLVACAQVIEKIYLLKPEKIVDVHFLKTIITDESHYSIFDFIESLISGNKSHALHVLDYLKAEGTEPALILWGITRELRLLAELGEKQKQGETYEALFKKYRIFFRRKDACRYFLKKFSNEDCFRLVLLASEIDQILKGAVSENIWHALQLFCLRF